MLFVSMHFALQISLLFVFRLMVRNVILVCTGNICRSPMAEALLAQRLADRGISVSSAGVAALVYHPADPLAQRVMEEHGFDITAHRARQAKREQLFQADLILTLDQTHSDWLRTRFPELQGRVLKLARWRNNADIEDPYRQPKEVFDRAFDEISVCVDDWADKIKCL